LQTPAADKVKRYSLILILMPAPLLQIQNLSIDFHADDTVFNAVKDISFNVEAGEITVIVGESGSGKSVTALSIIQLLPKQSAAKGKIIFTKQNAEAVDLLQLSAKEINTIRGKDISMIFQEPMTSLNPVLTCGSQVAEAIQLHQKVSSAVAKQQTISLFEKVKLPEPVIIFDRYPHQLSGGQKQRVMIAMAMSCNPSLLIADEPTTALDVTVQKTILSLIKELQQQTGMAVIFITHDLGLAAEIADNILVMQKGEIVEQGTAKDVLQNPQQDYTKMLLSCRPEGRQLTTDNRQPEIVLKVENLKVYFPQKKSWFGKPPDYFKAVDDVSFTVSKGETIGLVGESGCGKTTLGRTILQLIQPTSGNIILNGTNLAALSKKKMRPLRKDLQIIFQDPYGSLNPHLTIGSAIFEPMKAHGILTSDNRRKEKVIELLEKVRLAAAHYNQYPHQFSGGQRQRICIARALALNPSFLIFDESVSALDVSVQAQVLNLLNDLKKEFDFTSIFISHDLSIVHYISDRIFVMNKGEIVEQGTADEIYFSPKNEYTKKLIDAIPGKNLINLRNPRSF
jgi:peptide/nickel transport system ATP-binding protein